MHRSLRTALALVTAATLLSSPSLAAGKKKAAPADAGAQAQKEMEIAMQYAVPGKVHEGMARAAGQWKAHATFWMVPGQPPIESEGTSTFKTILGNRYLTEEYKTTIDGQPFEGFGLYGFDTYKKQFVSIWTDTWSTVPMILKGTSLDGGRTIVQSGRYDCPVSKKRLLMKSKLTHQTENRHLFEMWMEKPDGSMPKAFEIVYTR